MSSLILPNALLVFRQSKQREKLQVCDTIILAIPLPNRESLFPPIVFDYPASPACQGSLGVQEKLALLYCRKSLVTSLRASLVVPWRIPSSLVRCVYQTLEPIYTPRAIIRYVLNSPRRTVVEDLMNTFTQVLRFFDHCSPIL